MKRILYTIFIWITLFAVLLPLGCADENDASKNETTSAQTKVDILKSELCKKCACDADVSQIDCTNKLNEWFSATEWELLQNGDIVFEIIKMEYNNLTAIPALPTYGVQHLYLGHNQIAEIELGAFQNLTKLATLDLSHNQLASKALVPDVFQGPYSEKDFEPMKNLKSLNLGYNLLHSLDDDLFEHLTNLEELVLCFNTFQIIDKLTETALSGLSALKVLDISYMELKTLPETIFHGPRDLETLIASGNIFFELPKALSYAKNLRHLNLDANPIKSLEGENVFPAMSYLQYLSMSYMLDLNKIGAGALKELQNLTILVLSDNKMLSEIDVLAMAKNITGDVLDYPPLEKLYLNNCNLTTIPRSLIVRWDKLSTVDFRFNPWTCDDSNEYLIKHLIQRVNNTTPILASNVQCDMPQEMKGVELLTLAKADLRSVSHGGSLAWIFIIICVLLAIPLSVAGFVLYRRGSCRRHKRTDAALYSRTSFNEDFHI